jgi:hypothetical protein
MSLLPMFKRFALNGLTLTFDYAALGDHNMHGSPLRVEEWATVACPTLVAYGAKTHAGFGHRVLGARRGASERDVSLSAIVPVLAEFVAGSTAVAV